MDLWIRNSCSNCIGYYDQRLMAPGRWLANAQDDAGCSAPTSSPSEAGVNVRSRHPVGRDEVDARQEVEVSGAWDIGHRLRPRLGSVGLTAGV